MFRVGIVQQQDLVNGRVRVSFPDREQMVSYWLPIGVRGALHDHDWWMPDVGETVSCDMDANDEDGTVERAIYTEANPPPQGLTGDVRQLVMKDGAVFKYDRNQHALNVSLPAGSTMTLTANGATISIDANGNVTVHAAGGINLITSQHNDSVDNIINKFNSHVHSGVATGSGDTGVPTTQLT
jgi:phage baseplate assembly protein V